MPDIDNQTRLKAYSDWLQANATKKGTPEWEQVANNYKLLRTTPTEATTSQSDPDLLLGEFKPSNNVGIGLLNRGFGLVESTAKGIDQAGDWLQQKVTGQAPTQPSAFEEVATGIHKERTKGFLNYQQGTTWDDFKKEPSAGSFLKMAAESGITSTPDMVAAITSLPRYALSLVGDNAEARARANGREAPNGEDLLAALPTSAGQAATMRFGGKGAVAAKGIVTGTAKAVAGGAAGSAASSVIGDVGTTAGTAQGFDPKATAEHAVEAAVSGGAAGGLIHTTVGTGRTLKAAPGKVGEVRARLEYSQNPDQVASDVRVGKLYQDARNSVDQFKSGNTVPNDVVFKKVHDALKQQLYDGIDGLYRNGDITKDHRDALVSDADAVLKQAGQHNRDLGTVDVEKIKRMDLDPRVETGLINAFRDLNTATYAGLKKNVTGPFERFGKASAPLASTAAGYAAGGYPGGIMATLTRGAAKSAAGGTGRLIDRVLGLQEPEVLRRFQSRSAALQGQGVRVGDTANFLDDLRANTEAGSRIGNSDEANLGRQAASARAQMRMQDRVAGGGWDQYVYENTGLTPKQQDVVLLNMMSKGQLSPAQHRAYLKNPQALMRNNEGNALIDLMNAAADAGTAKRDPSWTPPGPASVRSDAPTSALNAGSEVRNPLAYQAAINNAHSARDVVASIAPSPELATAAHEVADIQTKDGRNARVDQALKDHPQHASWIEGVLRSLNHFGQDSAGTFDPAKFREGVGKVQEFLKGSHGVVAGGGIERTTKEVEAYKKAAGINTPSLPKGGLPMPETYLHKIADWMQEAKHDPNNPVVKRSYAALARETEAQFDHLVKSGNVKFEAYTGKGEPYRNSAEMLKDVRDNGHLYFFRTENGFGQQAADEGHPLLAETKFKDQNGKPLVVNDLFRVVHDYYGHSQGGFSFGEKGEYNAFNEHARMFSKEAIPALAAETLAQNAWVNFGPHLRNAEGKVPGPGEPGYRARPDRPFSEQKTVAVPEGLLRQDPNPESAARFSGDADPAATASKALANGAAPLSDKEVQSTSIPVLYDNAAAEHFDTILDYAKARDAEFAKLHGGPMTKLDEATKNHVANALTAEALHAIQNDGNAARWYRERVAAAHRIVGLMHPEVLTDALRKAAFNFALAVTSNGLTIAENTKLAESIYARYRGSNSGKFPTNMGTGDRASQMKAAFKLWNDMVDEVGQDKVVEWLSKSSTVRDLNKLGFTVSKELKDTVVPNSVVFGPKVGGGFYQNLMGNFDPLTMDRWFMRTWGRLTGNLYKAVNVTTQGKQEARLRAALTPDIMSDYGFKGDPAKLDSATLMELAENIWQDDRNHHFAKDDNTRERPEHKVAAQRLAEGIRKTHDAPSNGKQRKFMRETIAQAVAQLREHGIHLDAADLQALIWYPEKDLLAAHGIGNARSAPTDYQTEFAKLAQQRGISEEAIQRAVQADSGRGGQQPRVDVGPTEKGRSQKAGALTQRQEGNAAPF